MASTFISLKDLLQVIKEWSQSIFRPIWELTTAHPEHFTSGVMLGFSIAATSFICDAKISRVISAGTILAFVVAALKYLSQNLEKMKHYARDTTLILLAASLFLFHGVTSWTTVAAWLPVFTSVTLLATVHVAPGVKELFATLGAGFSRLIEIGDRVRIPRERSMDLEGQGLLSPMSENPSVGYQESLDMDFTLSHMLEGHPSEIRHEETDESVDLDTSTVLSRASIARLARVLDPLQNAAILHTIPIPEPNLSFPETPQGHPPERPFAGNVGDSRTEEPLLEDPLPG